MKRNVGLIIMLLAGHLFAADNDQHLWLEDGRSQATLQWITQQNKRSIQIVEAEPDFVRIFTRLLDAYTSEKRLSIPSRHGNFLYNFHQDQGHARGIFRRTTVEEYSKPDPAWETVFDLDVLAQAEKQNWIFKEVEFLKPDDDRCLVKLSHGGEDAVVAREFDVNSKQFVAGGFEILKSREEFCWRNRNALYVAKYLRSSATTNPTSHFAVVEWKRGTELKDAQVVFEARPTDNGVIPSVVHDHGRNYEFIECQTSYFNHDYFFRRGDAWVHVDVPADATLGIFDEYLLLTPESNWTVNGRTYRAGSILAENFDAYLSGVRNLVPVFEPNDRQTYTSYKTTKNYLLVDELDNVSSSPIQFSVADGQWNASPIEAPKLGIVSLFPFDSERSDEYFEMTDDFLIPPRLYRCIAGQSGRELIKSVPDLFSTDGLEVLQFEATSKDGTKVPYFQVGKKGMVFDGKNITLMTGYGGFQRSVLPNYRVDVGAVWLERGGTYVIANIRGGGEFGPTWHTAALKEHRQRSYDDFIAVAQDLIARKVTSPSHLGIMGGSNGGLLMGVMLTERPDLFGAVVCRSPLLDMQRFNKLQAGATTWIDEYGNPDDAADWEYIKKYSPYQNVVKDRTYPPVLFISATNDDRVNPAHARKMVAKMQDQGHNVLYLENTEGGHSEAANRSQTAFVDTFAYTFLWKSLR